MHGSGVCVSWRWSSACFNPGEQQRNISHGCLLGVCQLPSLHLSVQCYQAEMLWCELLGLLLMAWESWECASMCSLGSCGWWSEAFPELKAFINIWMKGRFGQMVAGIHGVWPACQSLRCFTLTPLLRKKASLTNTLLFARGELWPVNQVTKALPQEQCNYRYLIKSNMPDHHRWETLCNAGRKVNITLARWRR